MSQNFRQGLSGPIQGETHNPQLNKVHNPDPILLNSGWAETATQDDLSLRQELLQQQVLLQYAV